MRAETVTVRANQIKMQLTDQHKMTLFEQWHHQHRIAENHHAREHICPLFV